ncbi:MAG: MFS transporter [Pseudomonadota bacterium]
MDQRADSEAGAPAFSSRFCAAKSRRYLLIAAILASALGFIDGTVVAIALPAMRDSLAATLSQSQWFSNAYMLTLSALILVGGAAGDRFGIARVFRSGIVLFLIASLFCGIAPTPGSLIAARAVQGIGAALMVPGSLALIARTYPEEERGRAIGIWAAASAATTAAGPLIGGALLSVSGNEAWRLLFLVNLPLGGIALYLLHRHVVEDAVTAPAAKLDLPGAVLATIALGCIAFALTSGGHAEGAEPGQTIEGSGLSGLALGLAGVGLAALAAFLWVERQSPAPMMPLRLFTNANFSTANLATFVLYFALSGILFFLPMTLIAGWGESALTASLVFAPLTLAIALLSPRVGRWADRTGPRLPIALGSLLVAVGYGLMAVAAPFQAFWWGILPGGTVAGLGMALVVAPLSTAVMASAGRDASGAASGVNNAVSRIAGLFAVAGFGPIAAAAYAGSGGPESFGALTEAAGHAAAMSSAFATLAWIAAILAAASALITWLGLRTRQPARM